MNKTKICRLFLICPLFFLLVISSSCDEIGSSAVCPSIFTKTTVQVLTADDEPVILDQWYVVDKRSGKTLDLCEDDECVSGDPVGYKEMGIYLIIDDRFQGKTGRQRTLIVEGSNDSVQFSQEFTVRDNGCNIVKTDGPAAIVL